MKKVMELIKYNCLISTIFLTILYKLKFIDKNIIIESIRRHKVKKLKKMFSANLTKKDDIDFNKKEDYDRTIWTCWFQGEEEAPLIVKKCINSIRNNSNGWNVIVLDSENIRKYVNLPDSIIKKWNDGIITNTHFSDIIRCSLLVEHGGIWIDSTCLLTSNIPNYVFSGDFFCFKHKYRNEETIEFGSWFIFSKKNNPLLTHALELEIAYWEKHNTLADYFLFHLFIYILKDKYNDIWNFKPNISDVGPHELNRSFYEEYNSDLYDIITKQTFIQKLTYKIQDYSENSFLDIFMKGNFK